MMLHARGVREANIEHELDTYDERLGEADALCCIVPMEID